jgi:hypothetical protein
MLSMSGIIISLQVSEYGDLKGCFNDGLELLKYLKLKYSESDICEVLDIDYSLDTLSFNSLRSKLGTIVLTIAATVSLNVASNFIYGEIRDYLKYKENPVIENLKIEIRQDGCNDYVLVDIKKATSLDGLKEVIDAAKRNDSRKCDTSIDSKTSNGK